MHHHRDVHVVQHLEVGLEGLVVKVEPAVVTGQLHTHHAQFLHAALELVQVLLAPPGGQHGVGEQTPVRALAHVGGLVVHQLAGVQMQPLLPHRHAQKTDVHAGIVHGLQFGLQRVVAVDVVEVLVSLGLLQDELRLARLHRAQIGDLAPFPRYRAQEALEDVLVVKEILGQMVHVDVDDHAGRSLSIRVSTPSETTAIRKRSPRGCPNQQWQRTCWSLVYEVVYEYYPEYRRPGGKVNRAFGRPHQEPCAASTRGL